MFDLPTTVQEVKSMNARRMVLLAHTKARKNRSRK